MFSKGYFVIGTDTDIGKTFCSSCLYLGLKDKNGIYYKPVQSGGIKKDDKLYAPDVISVCEKANIPYQDEMVTYVLEPEVSPHLASEIEGTKIDIDKIREDFKKLKEKYDYIVVEGAGGLHVPIIRDKYYIYDLIREFNFPVVLVSSTKVGSINHTVLTLKSLENLNIPVHGIIFNRVKDDENTKIFEEDNIKEILKNSPIQNYLVIKENEEKIDEKKLEKFLNGGNL